MATFEERELVDYAFKKFEEIMETNDKTFMVKDLDKLHSRVRRLEETARRLIERTKNLENRVRTLEERGIRILEESSSE